MMQMIRLISSFRNVKTASRISLHQTRLFRHQPEDLARPIGKIERSVNEPTKEIPTQDAPIINQPIYKSGHLKQLAKQYGSIAFICFAAVSYTNIGVCYLAVKFGLVNHLTENETFADLVSKYPNFSLGTEFVLTYVIHKLLAPLRYSLAALLTPKVAKFLRKRGWMKRLLHRDSKPKK